MYRYGKSHVPERKYQGYDEPQYGTSPFAVYLEVICNGVSLRHHFRRFLWWWWLFSFTPDSEGRYSHNYGSGGQGYGGGSSDKMYGGSRRGGEYR